MINFWKKLIDAQHKNKSALVAGLDPEISKLPEGIEKNANGVEIFAKEIIRATSDIVCAYKPNLAFYLALGVDGISVLQNIVSAVPADIPVILDAKFGDVEHTAKNYAAFSQKTIKADAVTVNPYIGQDTIKPFVERELGIILLCATSNPSYSDIETLPVENEPLFIRIAKLASIWSAKFNTRLGIVVGATHPELFAQIRSVAPNAPFLIPGIGAQGGELENAVKFGQTNDGIAPLLVSARGIIYASSGKDFAGAARASAEKLRLQINEIGGLFDD